MRHLSRSSQNANCRRVRLAESPVAVVDVCECGVMHLQLGPFSLRIAADALVALYDTLGDAIAANEARERDVPGARHGFSRTPARRGEA